MSKKAYSLALSIYSHVRHGDYMSAKHLLLELTAVVNEIVAEEEATQKLKEAKNG
jgi:hypothetical protein